MLLFALLRVCVSDRHAEVPATLRRELQAASKRDWNSILPELELHRLTPLLLESIDHHGLRSCVPEFAYDRMAYAYRETALANRVYANALREIVTFGQERGLDPVVIKGLALADTLYPDPATRPMLDVDVLVPRGAASVLRSHLIERGFEQSAPWRGFKHGETGISIDVHDGWTGPPLGQLDELTTRAELPSLAGVPVRMWEPNACLVYLCAHLEKHTHVYGPMLLWIVDLIFLVRRHADELSVDRLRELAGDDRSLDFAWSSMRFARDRCAWTVPDSLAAPVESARELSVSWVLRQKRLQSWGFPRRRFYLRFMARVLRLRPLAGRRWLHWTDVPHGWIDLVIDRRTRG